MRKHRKKDKQEKKRAFYDINDKETKLQQYP